jgi:HSP20 family protein
MVRHDFGNILNRFFGAGLLDYDDRGGAADALASFANYGVDIREDANHVYIEADLPGFRKEDVDIAIEDGVLTITAERREEVVEPDAGQAATPGQGGDARQQAQQGQAPQGQAQQGQQPQQKPQQPQQPARQHENYLLRERRIQRFVRSFTLPPNVDEQSVQAKLENGVLRITLNKREDTKPKRVQVS